MNETHTNRRREREQESKSEREGKRGRIRLGFVSVAVVALRLYSHNISGLSGQTLIYRPPPADPADTITTRLQMASAFGVSYTL